MTLQDKQALFARNISQLIEFIYAHGYTITFGEAFRTVEQAEIYAKSGKGIKDSLHCKRLALDINLFKDGNYLPNSTDHKPFGEYWESLHPLNRWGGVFKERPDGNHYEMNDA